MSTFPSDNDDEVYEALSNALVRRVIFVKGAVDMSGLPPDDRGEVAFIGRSNVGKSSLVNMITNRKALAYTSRTPGKTQEFNYFAVNDKPLKEKEIKYGDTIAGEPDDDTFYLVDLPGFGFAKVPTAQRRDWADFMSSYLSKRKTLKVVFHLIDSRHGPIDEDSNIMKQISTNLPRHVSYVVVLTKADKNLKRKGGSVISGNSNSNVKAVKKKTHGWVSSNVMTKVRDTMQENGVGNAPVLLTSSETKLGRDHLWRYIRLAAES
jgi:GTP-binding protein EngB required for normal cell division